MISAKKLSLALAPVLLSAVAAWAAAERGVMVREANLYLSPDPNSQKLAVVERGREIVILEQSNNWLHVMANITGGTDGVPYDEGRQVTGWMLTKGVIRTNMPDGDKILFGEAADSEAQASQRRGRRGAAQDALRLYERTAEYFPTSPKAGEAAFRAADIRWQLERADVMSRPSARQRDPNLREGMSEDALRQVEKKFPHTQWADRAAFDLIDNKLCGEWQGASKCPDKEADLYEKYAQDRPDSPVIAEALYNAAWRRAALVEIYKTENDLKKSADARGRAQVLCQRIIGNYAQTDWAMRAQTLLYKLDQGIPTFGNLTE